MSFSCDIDNNGVTFETIHDHKSADTHKCIECGYEIKPQEPHALMYGMILEGDCDDEGGGVATGEEYRYCSRCDDLTQAFYDVGFCIEFGDFFSSYAEWLDEFIPVNTDEDDDETAGEKKASSIKNRHKEWSE